MHDTQSSCGSNSIWFYSLNVNTVCFSECVFRHALVEWDVGVVVETEHDDGRVVFERTVDSVEELFLDEELPRVHPLGLHQLDLTVDEPRRRSHAQCRAEHRQTFSFQVLCPPGTQ
jgi:hypothetical protein